MNYATRPLMSFCLTSVILVSSAAGAAKDSSNTLSDEIKRERKALQELKEEIEDKQKKADEASEQRQSVLQSIQNLDDKLIVRRQQRYSVSRELKEKDRKELKEKMAKLRMDAEFARRYVNDGFSGGEMKRAEILQLAMLQPKFAVLDETDSGLDADAVRLASQSIAEIGRDKMGLLIITHHDKLLVHNPPDFTHVMLGGRLVETGGIELAQELHERGYERIRAAYPDADAQNRAMLEKEEPEKVS